MALSKALTAAVVSVWVLSSCTPTFVGGSHTLDTFRGQARFEYRDSQERFKSSQMISVKAPDKVRIDVMGLFGPLYSMASDGSRLTAYDRGERVFYRGAASAENLGRYTRVALEGTVLALLLRGLDPAGLAGSGIEARFSDYREVSGRAVAHRVEVDLDSGARVILVYDHIWTGINLSDEIFEITAPRGVRVVDLDGDNGGQVD